MGNGTFAENPKKCEDENDADGLKTYFATDFKIIFNDFDEKFVTRESICGHFYPGGWGWGGI